jgi:hypothetical protein
LFPPKLVHFLAALLLVLFSARAGTFAQRHYGPSDQSGAYTLVQAPAASHGKTAAPSVRDEASSLRSSLISLPTRAPVRLTEEKAPLVRLKALVSVKLAEHLRPPSV